MRLREDKVSKLHLLGESAVDAKVQHIRPRVQTLRPFTFVLSHAGGESVVLAAESEKEMHEWMQAVRTSRMCVSDSTAANMLEEARRASADSDLDSARDKRIDPEAELSRIEGELESVQVHQGSAECECVSLVCGVKAEAPVNARSAGGASATRS